VLLFVVIEASQAVLALNCKQTRKTFAAAKRNLSLQKFEFQITCCWCLDVFFIIRRCCDSFSLNFDCSLGKESSPSAVGEKLQNLCWKFHHHLQETSSKNRSRRERKEGKVRSEGEERKFITKNHLERCPV
jgi:hypothetical protein